MTSIHIGTHLKAAREAADLSSGDAAKKIGVSPMSMSRYEHSKRLPDAQVLLKMTEVYGCDLVTLMTGVAGGDRPKPIPIRGKLADRTKFELDLKEQPKEFLPLMSDRPGAFAVKVVGNWMKPTAYHGEYLICDSPEEAPFLEVSVRGEGGGLDLVRGRTVGKLLGVYRKTA